MGVGEVVRTHAGNCTRKIFPKTIDGGKENVAIPLVFYKQRSADSEDLEVCNIGTFAPEEEQS